MFYLFNHKDIHLVDDFLRDRDANAPSPPGCGALVEYMQQKTLFHGMRIPGAFSLIGNKAGLREYKLLRQSFSSKLTDKNLFVGGLDRIEKTSYARVGLMGNPSDGYFGKTLGLSVRTFGQP